MGRFQAIVIRGHLRLHLQGLKHSRMSGKQLLSAATSITGQIYKQGQYEQALNDINIWIKENKDA